MRYARKALKEQGAKAVIFELHGRERAFYDKLGEARRIYEGKILFYFSDEHVLKEIK